MSNQQSSSFASFSYSSSSSYSHSGSNGPETRSQSYSEKHTYNNRDGHVLTKTSQKDGGPIYQQTAAFPAARILRDTPAGGQGRIEDVSAADEEQAKRDKEYEERMEDEYAKREGGA